MASVIAIIFAISGGIGYWSHNGSDQQMMVVVAGEGIVKEVVLPDGTKVWLNNSATLKYPREFSENERNVHLEGEAYFEVTKNRHKPFTVQSGAMCVRVLGTTFNFKCDKRCRIAEATLIEGEIEVKGNKEEGQGFPFQYTGVSFIRLYIGRQYNLYIIETFQCSGYTLIEGEIEVKGNKEEGQIILTPGQRAELNKSNGRLTVKQVDAKLDAVWHNNLIPFQKADIFAITRTLELLIWEK